MRCLQCDIEMLKNMVGDVEIDLCILCGGIFLDSGEFTRLSGLTLDGFDRTPGRRVTCPKCAGVMEEIRVEGVEIDLCPGCGGVWLDHHELARFPTVDHALLDKNRIVAFIESKESLIPRSSPGGPGEGS